MAMTDQELADAQAILAKGQDRVRVIFVQRQFPKRAARAVAASIGGVVTGLDPLAYDYLAGLREMARKVNEALGKGGGRAR